MKKININLEKIDTVYHLSDLHIRNLQRHKEYRQAFEKIFEEIKKDTNNAICILTGDIVHSKTDLSPELVSITYDFFKKLSEILPMFIITGNHDCNLTNLHRLDTLAPIVDALNSNNIFYLKYSDLYPVANINLNVFSILDPNDRTALEKPLDKLTIGLYHGVVSGASLDSNYVLKEGKSLSLFDNHDIVMLGDIHKMQTIQQYQESPRKPIITYAGSCIQQNFGESVENHGMLKWNLNTKTYTLIPIKNEYGYCTVNVKDDKITDSNLKDWIKYPRLRIIYENTSEKMLSTIKAAIKEDVSDILYFELQEINNSTTILGDHEKLLSNITNIDYQNELIGEHFKSKFNKDIIKKLKEINTKTNQLLAIDDKSNTNINWKLESLEFSNLFNYDEKNKIDFSDMSKLNGLFAPNATGKCVDAYTKIQLKYDLISISKRIGFVPKELKNHNRHTVLDVYNLFKKYGNLQLLVNTQYGYKEIEACDITAKDSKNVVFRTKKGKRLSCAPDHLVKLMNGDFKKVETLRGGDKLQTIDGSDEVVEIILLDLKKDLYDLQVRDVQQYYTNGIVSHNSSLIDTVLYGLYDKTSRTSKLKDIMNKNKDNFHLKISFKIDDETYYIEKGAKKNINSNTGEASFSSSLNFWKIDRENKEIMLNEDSIPETRKAIRNYVGTYDNAILSSFSLQNNRYGFIEMTNSEKKDLIFSFLGFDLFDKLYRIANKEKNKLNILAKNYDEEQLNEDINNFVTEFESNTKLYEDQEKLLKEYKLKKLIIENDILKLQKQIINLGDDKDLNLDKLEINKKEYSELKDEHLKKVSEVKNVLKILLTDTKKLSDELKEYDKENIDENVKELLNLDKEHSQIDLKLSSYKLKLEDQEEKIKQLDKIKHDPNCEYCMSNMYVIDALNVREENKKTIIQHKELKSSFDNIIEKIDKLQIYNDKSIKFDNLIKNKNELKNKYISLKAQIEISEGKINLNNELISMVDTKIERYYKNQETIKNNIIKDKEIELLNEKLINVPIDNLIIQMRNLNAAIEVNKNNLQLKQNDLSKYKELSNNFKLYKHYCSIVHRDGLPNLLIVKILPTIEQEINNLLTKIVNFKIKARVDDKDLNFNIQYSNQESWSLSLGSGMEKFVTSVAIRDALNKISIQPKSNFMFIDEGVSDLDVENLSNISLLFDYLKMSYQFILLISHLSEIKDYADDTLSIINEDDKTRIVYP